MLPRAAALVEGASTVVALAVVFMVVASAVVLAVPAGAAAVGVAAAGDGVDRPSVH
jgi:hypothetical protein